LGVEAQWPEAEGAIMTIPVIDLSAGDAACSETIGRACRDTGFFVVINHGVQATLLNDVYRVAEGFFDLPLADKAKAARPRPEQNRGFQAVGTETLSRLAGIETPPDYKEVFTIGPFDLPDDTYYTCDAAYPNFAPNLWPERPTEMKMTLTQYWRSIVPLATRLLSLCAQALDLPSGYFAPYVDRHVSMLRLISYPGYRDAPQPGQLRAGVHTDLNMLTLVHSNSDVGGLEVRDRSGRWVAAPYRPEAYVVNIGDIMMRWTNDLWISTPHRVANPPQGWRERRISLPFFFQANYDAVIECLPTCRSPEMPAKYPPITVGAYRTERFARTANAAVASSID
jgi:isopenicillin N synthase-like dioxygenase